MLTIRRRKRLDLIYSNLRIFNRKMLILGIWFMFALACGYTKNQLWKSIEEKNRSKFDAVLSGRRQNGLKHIEIEANQQAHVSASLSS